MTRRLDESSLREPWRLITGESRRTVRIEKLPRIAVTMGDPAGVGPELCLRLLADEAMARECVPIVFGDAGLLERVAETMGLPFHARVTRKIDASLASPCVLDLRTIDAATVMPGVVSAACGDAAFRYVIAAIEAAVRGDMDAICTGPLNKEAMHAAGHHYPGHTEIFAERFKAERSCMAFFSDEMACSLVTVHIGYQDVVAQLSSARILDVIELTADAVRRIHGRAPRLVVCGLNPHAGEHGLFGRREEEEIIVPAINAARQRGLDVSGPAPPDTAFIASRRRETDAYICMYHDQALIPLKALAFDSAVNTTLGLPVPRTSVDHGTAFDIAWQGKAGAGSLFAAMKLAVRLARQADAGKQFPS